MEDLFHRPLIAPSRARWHAGPKEGSCTLPLRCRLAWALLVVCPAVAGPAARAQLATADSLALAPSLGGEFIF
jgi:hypothetical protein